MTRLVKVMTVGIILLPSTAFGTESSVPFIRADQVHAQGITGQGVTVAVIDTGIYFDYPGLQYSIAPGGTSFEGGVEQPDGGADIYGDGHGTYMSLIITDSSGVAPDADILSIRVFGPGGTYEAEDLVLGIRYATEQRRSDPSIRVINLSLGSFTLFTCPCDLDAPDQADAISQAAAAGIITFGATGNEAYCGGIGAPACVSAAVPVAANYDGDYGYQIYYYPSGGVMCGDINPEPYYVTCFSNYVEECAALGAPGFDISVGGFSGDGTSQATAHCSGVAALMFEKNGCGALTAYWARAIMYNTGWDVWWAYPYCDLPPPPRHINALSAVNAVYGVPCVPGDLNCDGVVDINDIVHFVPALVDPTGYDADHDGDPYPVCNRTAAEMNGDHLVNGADIQVFVNTLLSP